MKKNKERITIKLTCYPETNKIICERKWAYHGNLKDVDFDEFVGMVDEDVNGDYWDNSEAYQVELTLSKGGETLRSIISILNRPPKQLYNLRVVDTFQDIRDMLYGKDVRETFENNTHLFNE